MNELFRMFRILMDKTGDNPPAGGPPPPTLTPPTPPPATPPATPPPTDWRAALPEDIRGDESLKVIHDVPSLAKSFINAQKLIGADKVVIPSKHATDEDWRQVYHKLGLPTSLDGYEVKLDEKAVSPEFATSYKETAHKLGIFPKQAQALADWFKEQNAAMGTKVQENIKQEQIAGFKKLQEKWGKAFETKLNKAEYVLQQAGVPEAIQYFKDSGLNSDPRLVEFLASIGDKFLTEDHIPNTRTPNGGMGALTPNEAESKINSILADPKHPYYDSTHPGHKGAVAEMTQLFQMRHPSRGA